MQWETVIGLEVHTQLSCQSKIFSGASAAYGAEPNTQACPVDLGMPGTLPVLNERAVNLALRFGLAIDADIADTSIFARKNYFYPDLPKGYQISQFDHPIVGSGKLVIEQSDGSEKTVRITRAHLEEDAGKSIHRPQQSFSAIDLNRAGTPLLEIVSEPDIRSADEAVAYLKTLHHLVRYLGISDGNMQEGSFRCDVNISLRQPGETTFGTRVEIKNLNSFRFVKKAIAVEEHRQAARLESGETIHQETRLYDPDRDETRSMRSKEEAFDYRYYPDPDLLPVRISQEHLTKIRDQLPELPKPRKHRLIESLGFSEKEAELLLQSRELADFAEATLAEGKTIKPKLLSNWLLGEFQAYLNQHARPISDSRVTPAGFAELLQLIENGMLSSSAAKTVLAAMLDTAQSAAFIVKEKGLEQVSDTAELEKLIDTIISENPDQVAEYKAGKTKLMAFFIGKMMKATQGKANPKLLTELIQKRLKN